MILNICFKHFMNDTFIFYLLLLLLFFVTYLNVQFKIMRPAIKVKIILIILNRSISKYILCQLCMIILNCVHFLVKR